MRDVSGLVITHPPPNTILYSAQQSKYRVPDWLGLIEHITGSKNMGCHFLHFSIANPGRHMLCHAGSRLLHTQYHQTSRCMGDTVSGF